jgi:exonuclease SbcC
MIIHSLSCENLLKYRRLQLHDLPQRGMIAISGQNESGKSSIGESVCFALFGRTFAVGGGDDDLEKLVRWGESICSANLEFGVGDGGRYRVERFLDRDGNHSARLCRVDEPDKPLARGADAVTDALYGILGYEFDEFVESFYLAQREITTPHPHSYAVKIMAGIAPMEYCRGEFQEELEREQEAIETARSRAGEITVQIEQLGFDGARLQILDAERLTQTERVSQVRQRRDDLIDAAAEYQEREPLLRAAEERRGTATGLRFLFLLLALAALGGWAALTRLSSHALVEQLADALQQLVPGWHAQWLLYAGAALAALFVLFWIRVAAIDARIKEQRGAGGRLSRELELLDELEAALPDEARGAQGGDADGETGETPALRADPELRDHLRERVDQGTVAAEEVRTAVERDSGWLDQCAVRLQRRIAELDAEIGGEQARREEHDKLGGMLAAFEQQQAEHEHRARLRQLADELLLGISRHLSHRFNHNLRGLVGKTLPLFTEGRYEHLQIDEELSVRAFSSEKRDFMDLDEISSGTQRQIMLALRLALSQELINRVVRGPQFAFLDEPFAFFDENRTRSALSVLPRLSDEITQVWIVAQAFPQDIGFDLRIHCDRAVDIQQSAGSG